MKKIYILTFIVLVFITFTNKSYAHLNFQEIDPYNGKLLSDYKTKEIKEYYSKVEKRKFSGWRTYIINDFEIEYIKETLLSYHNTGTTPIDYSYERKYKSTYSSTFSVKGDIKLKGKSGNKSLEKGLETSIGTSYERKSSEEITEKIELDISVDPNTVLNLYIVGKGKIINGVSAQYSFWIRRKKGSFEIFSPSTEYQRLEKLSI